jgi:hypothetical protein
MTADEVAASVVGMLDELGIERACVMAHSYGEGTSMSGNLMGMAFASDSSTDRLQEALLLGYNYIANCNAGQWWARLMSWALGGLLSWHTATVSSTLMFEAVDSGLVGWAWLT